MLTPRFSLVQDDTSITLYIKAPYTKVSDAEVDVLGCEVTFYSKPYYLRDTALLRNLLFEQLDQASEYFFFVSGRQRLHLPGELLEDGGESASYDADQGTFTIRIPKRNPGEEFPRLDLLTELLTPKGSWSAKPLVLESQDVDGASAEAVPCSRLEEFDWYIPQELPPEEEHFGVKDCDYGFANRRSGVFSQLTDELCLAVDLKDPDSTPATERRLQRQEAELAKFSSDHYLADLYENQENLDVILNFKPSWFHLLKEKSKVEFSEEDRDDMRDLPKRSYNLTETEARTALLSLLDIVFAYAYNHRITEGENCVESSWNICKLSATLSWLEVPFDLKEMVVTSLRRCLCYPLFRHWELALTVLKDVQTILTLGREQVLRCLLESRRLLAQDGCQYILNDLYLTDYCIWVQTASFDDAWLKSLTKSIKQVSVQKVDLQLGLDALELSAQSALENEDEVEAGLLLNQVSVLTLEDDSDDEEEEEEEESSEETDDSDSDSSSGSGDDKAESVCKGSEDSKGNNDPECRNCSKTDKCDTSSSSSASLEVNSSYKTEPHETETSSQHEDCTHAVDDKNSSNTDANIDVRKNVEDCSVSAAAAEDSDREK